MTKAVESAVRELHTLIYELTKKVTSLEASVSDQNVIITNQVEAINQLRIQVEGKQLTLSAGSALTQPATQRPIRQARLIAAANIATNSSAAAAAKKPTAPKEKVRQSTSGTASPKCDEAKKCPPKRISASATADSASKVTTIPVTNATKQTDSALTSEDEPWQTVSRKRPSTRPRRILTGSGKVDDELQTAEQLKFIQVWSIRPETTVDNVRSHLNKITKCEKYTVEKREIKTNTHAVFVIGFPERLYDILCTPNSWPQGVKISDWFRRFPRQSAERGSFVTAAGHSDTSLSHHER